MESQASAQEQLDQLAADREALRTQARRKVKVPRPPWKWPTRREWLLLIPALLTYNAVVYFGFKFDQRWLVTASAGVLAVILIANFYRDQPVVFRDER